MTKTIAVDTNLLLDDSSIIYKLSKEYDCILIPRTVLKELDKHKYNPNLSYSARNAIMTIRQFKEEFPEKIKFHIQLCDSGCNQEANFHFKSGRWCCSNHISKCPKIRHRKRLKQMGSLNGMYGKKHTLDAKRKISECNTGNKHTLEAKIKIGIASKGRIKSEEVKLKISKNRKGKKSNKTRKHTIESIIKKYPLFSRIEEMRYNPDKPEEKEIQVHCKNHNCSNSKEQGGWFTPKHTEINERIHQIEKGYDGSYFYCSNECKISCPLYNLRSDPIKNNELPYAEKEYEMWKQQVLTQDNYECQKCGSTDNLHCHHVIPVKLEPMFSLDPDNGIVLCKDCHYKYGHRNGSKCSTGNLSNSCLRR